LFWCKLAEKLSRPICELKQTVPMSEIRLWLAYIASEYERHEVSHYYWAQICLVIRQTMAAKKQRVGTIKDFLIKFRKPKQTASDREAALNWAKTWLKNMGGIAVAKKAKRSK
jgi:hypothetical protein